MKKIVIFLILICSFETVEARDWWAHRKANAAMEEAEEANKKLNQQNEDIVYLKRQVEAIREEIRNGKNNCTTVPVRDSDSEIERIKEQIEYLKGQIKYLKSENEVLQDVLLDVIDSKKE